MDRRPSTLNLQKQFDNLQKQYQTLEQKQQQTHASLLKFQQKSQDQERELSLYKRSQERFAREKEDIEKTNSQQKTYIRKLETRLAQGAKGQHLVEVNNVLRDQMTETKEEKNQLLSQIQASQNQMQQLADQVKVLTTALELKADDFQLEGELRTSLLYDVGHSRQELVKMKEKYAKMKKDSDSMRSHLGTALTNIEELKIIRESNNQELNRLELELQQREAKLETLQSNLNKVTSERLQLLDTIKETSNEKMALENKCWEYQEQVALLEKDYSQFKTFMSSTINNLQQDNQTLFQQKTTVDEVLKQKVHQEKSFSKQKEEIYRDLDKVSYEKTQIQDQMQALQDQLKLSVKINEELKSVLTDAEKDKQDLETELDQAVSELKEKRKLLQNSQKDQQTTEHLLKEKLEKTLMDLDDLAQEKEKIKKVLQDTVTQYTEAVQEQQHLQSKYDQVLVQVKQCKQAKDILQKTFTEQINALNLKIQQGKEEARDLEDQNTDLKVQIQTLNGLIKQEQRKNQLIHQPIVN